MSIYETIKSQITPSNGLTALRVISNGCLELYRYRAKMAHECRCSVLLLQAKAGKTTLCESIKSDTHIFVDIDRMVETAEPSMSTLDSSGVQYEMAFKKRASEIYEDLKKNYVIEGGKNLVVVTSNSKVAGALWKKNLFAIIPSRSLFEKMVADSSADDKDRMYRSREEFILAFGRGIRLYASFDELISIVKRAYGIRETL